jgi:thermitase
MIQRHTRVPGALKALAAISFTLAFATAAFAQIQITNYNGVPVVAGEVIVRLRNNDVPTQTRVRNAVGTANIDLVQSQLALHVVRAPGQSLPALLQALNSNPDVLYAEPNYVLSAIATPNDPLYSSLYGMTIIDAPTAWDLTTGGTSVVVGVIDSGIDYNHPDLAANIWNAPAAFTVTIGGSTINCPAGSHGFNALALTCNPLDDNNHGTHVSGTIGAVGNNGIGVVGVNWTARIMGLKFLNAGGTGSTTDAIRTIDFATQVKQLFASTATPVDIRVLNASWGGGPSSQSLLDAINLADSSDMLFVAAAGNDATNNDVIPHYPASFNAPNIIAVAATGSTDALAGFSNYGKTTVHMAAPGVSINSTIRNGAFAFFNGTSMATPHVSGAALLTLSVCPSLTTGELKSAILNNLDIIPSLGPVTITGGRLNVNRTVRSCSGVGSTLANASFETPALGASYVYNPVGPGVGWNFEGSAGIQGNGSAWQATSTSDGTQTAFIQNTGTIGQTVTLNAGTYTLSFRAARRLYSSPAGGVQPIQLSIDGAPVGAPVTPASTSFGTVNIAFSIGSSGPHALSFAGTDNTGDKSTFIDAVTIAAGATVPPAITSAPSAAFTEGKPATFTVFATGTPTPALTRTGNLPGGVNFTDNGDGTATLAGTPAAGTAGFYPLTITATSTAGTANQSFTLNVGVPAGSLVNASFEMPALGASYQYNPSGFGLGWSFIGSSGIQGNGSAWQASPAPSGTQTAFIQNTGAIRQSLPLGAGTYALTFQVAQRAYSDPAGGVQPIVVSIDGIPVGPLVTPASTSFGTVSIPFTISSSGTHMFQFAGTDNSGDKSTFIDGVGIAPNGPVAPLITSISGTSFVIGQAATFMVQATGLPAPTLSRTGTLPMGLSFVDNGNGTATLSGAPAAGTAGTYPQIFTATNSVGTTNQNFTLVVGTPGTVSNSSFETPALGAGFQYNPTGLGVGWSFVGASGIQGNGSAWLAAPAPNGTQTAFVQNAGAINGLVNLTAGSYTLNFQAARRSYSDPSGSVQPIRVSIDGVQIGSLVAPAGTSFGLVSIPFVISASGVHSLQFAGTDATGDKTTFIDAVAITP